MQIILTKKGMVRWSSKRKTGISRSGFRLRQRGLPGKINVHYVWLNLDVFFTVDRNMDNKTSDIEKMKKNMELIGGKFAFHFWYDDNDSKSTRIGIEKFEEIFEGYDIKLMKLSEFNLDILGSRDVEIVESIKEALKDELINNDWKINILESLRDDEEDEDIRKYLTLKRKGRRDQITNEIRNIIPSPSPFNYALKSDYIRMRILDKYKGLYLDTDVLITEDKKLYNLVQEVPCFMHPSEGTIFNVDVLYLNPRNDFTIKLPSSFQMALTDRINTVDNKIEFLKTVINRLDGGEIVKADRGRIMEAFQPRITEIFERTSLTGVRYGNDLYSPTNKPFDAYYDSTW